jgi:hypothetical protein
MKRMRGRRCPGEIRAPAGGQGRRALAVSCVCGVEWGCGSEK